MPDNETPSPEEILNSILIALQSEDDARILQAIDHLHAINYSSDSIRRKLEKLALSQGNVDIRKGAADALNLPTNRFVRSRVNRLSSSERSNILKEINDWEKSHLMDATTAEVIRR